MKSGIFVVPLLASLDTYNNIEMMDYLFAKEIKLPSSQSLYSIFQLIALVLQPEISFHFSLTTFLAATGGSSR